MWANAYEDGPQRIIHHRAISVLRIETFYAMLAPKHESARRQRYSAADPHPSSLMEMPANIMPVLTRSAPITMHVPTMPAGDHSVSLRVLLLHLLGHSGNGQGQHRR